MIYPCILKLIKKNSAPNPCIYFFNNPLADKLLAPAANPVNRIQRSDHKSTTRDLVYLHCLKKLNFAYLSSDDPTNKKVWSGSHYSILKSLHKLGHVDILGPYQPKIRILVAGMFNQL